MPNFDIRITHFKKFEMWSIFALFLLFVPSITRGGCPSVDKLQTEAHACFEDYSSRFHSMRHSTKKLCCGIDVERLRAFCGAYIDGARCVSRLKARCPAKKHIYIDKALVNLNGARQSLNDLCSDDRIIENYAMYQSCFTSAGQRSEECFITHLEGHSSHSSLTSSIRFLTQLDEAYEKDATHFCRKMQRTMSCIKSNVLHTCGPQAADLASVLSKPMVRHSTQCDYTVDIAPTNQDPKRPFQGNAAYISDGHTSETDSNMQNNNHITDNRNTNKHKTRQASGSRNSAHHKQISFMPSCIVFVYVSAILCKVLRISV